MVRNMTYGSPKLESPQVSEALAESSPFRNGDIEAQGAKEIFEFKGNHRNRERLGYVLSKDGIYHMIALPCEHLVNSALDCRFRCERWQAATPEAIDAAEAHYKYMGRK